MENPIDKDKVAENPAMISYPHHVGSIMIKPEDSGKLKSRALSAMYQQTEGQLQQIQKQVELMLAQANEIKRRISISEKIYQAKMAFEPFVGNVYHLYSKHGEHVLMMIAPEEWGKTKKDYLQFVASVKLLSDHTWEILEQSKPQ